MAYFVLVPGAGGMAWYWSRVSPLIRNARHEAVAVDLPGDDERAGLDAYADIVARAIGGRSDAILVAQSLAGFIAPLVCMRVPISMLVLINAMVPAPGQTAGAWFEATGAIAARKAAAERDGYSADFDMPTYFLRDVPEEVLRGGPAEPRQEADVVFAERCRFTHWPDIPIRVLAGRDDRFFPIDFQRRVARQRLGKDADEIPGGHLVALSNSDGLAAPACLRGLNAALRAAIAAQRRGQVADVRDCLAERAGQSTSVVGRQRAVLLATQASRSSAL
jgi:pimeloyl-ACP methyl ester carboxylesterase